MSLYDDPLGSILIGSWISSMLFMLIITKTITYYTSFKSDALRLKLFVAFAVTVDTLSLIGDYADVYLYTVSHWGDQVFLRSQYWPFALYLTTTGVTGLLSQSFLVNRYYALTKNWLVCVFLAICIIVSFGGSVAMVFILVRFNEYSERFMIKTPASLWLTTTAVTDILISLLLIWQLYKMKTSFKTTEHLIHRLMHTSMQTGTTTSVLALSILIFYLVNNTSNIATGLCFILSRVYVLTLLFNLTLRKIPKKEGTSSTDRGDSRCHIGPSIADGIHVQRTAVVHIENSVDDLAMTVSSCRSQNDDKQIPLVVSSYRSQNKDREVV
ncbi:hypothetical protein BDZ89DRAFT_1162836 [Hymenopellis radicata]|nr:hypothetical protein BDZ89DRAFT_1162836 [Hymenopellis radicata]